MSRSIQRYVSYILAIMVGLSIYSHSHASSSKERYLAKLYKTEKYTRYDSYFKKHTRDILPLFDPKLVKAQAIQESNMNPRAVSHVGAKGLMQFMPATWREVTLRTFGVERDPFNPEYSIIAGTTYMKYLLKLWKAERPYVDRIKLALASYNAGAGNILKAQRLCGNKNLYDEIIACLPRVTGRHSKETIGYVKYIFRNYYLI